MADASIMALLFARGTQVIDRRDKAKKPCTTDQSLTAERAVEDVKDGLVQPHPNIANIKPPAVCPGKSI
jgi:hypothetical protein